MSHTADCRFVLGGPGTWASLHLFRAGHRLVTRPALRRYRHERQWRTVVRAAAM